VALIDPSPLRQFDRNPREGLKWGDIVEKRLGGRGIISNHNGWGAVDDGERQVHQDALFYEFSLERHVPERHLLRLSRDLLFELLA
jgi:hypothetical protein